MLKTGIGAGKRQYRCPGILRAMLIRETTDLQIKDIIWKLETDMDDCGGEDVYKRQVYLCTKTFSEISRTAGYLMIPYLVWLTFAGYLNFFIFLLN